VRNDEHKDSQERGKIMKQPLSRWLGTTDIERRLEHEVSNRLTNLERVRHEATLSIREMGGLRRWVSRLAINELAQVQQELEAAQAAGRMTPNKKRAVYHRTQAYLYELLSLTEDVDDTVKRLLVQDE
jgi:hypothetical protein